MTEWHRAYIQNAYRELETGITRNQLETLGIAATGKKVLDVGCGPGNLLIALSVDAPELLVGVDIDAAFLRYGRSRIQESTAIRSTRSAVPRLLSAALPSLPFPDATFDLVTCFLVMPHVPDDREALMELTRVLKPGGTLALSGHGFGFPLKYLKRFRVKPLQMYLASLVYRATGKKWIRNTLQNDRRICRILRGIGVVPEMKHYNKRVLGCVATYWIKAIKSESTPKATQ